MNQGQRLRRAFAVAVAALTLVAFPASAPGATRSQSATLTTFFEVITLTPKCPSGQRATGGGFFAAPAGPMGTADVRESRKIGQRSWRVTVRKAGGAGLLPVTAFVYCRKDAPKTKTKSATVTLPGTSGVIGVADARCGSAGNAQAGGFSRTAIGHVADSFRSGKKTWRSRLREDSPYPAGLTSYAYCADEPAPKARSGSTSAAGFPPYVVAVSQGCKKGTRPAAGGFSQPDLSPSGRYDYPNELFRSGKTWRTAARHGGAASTTLTSIAYCV